MIHRLLATIGVLILLVAGIQPANAQLAVNVTGRVIAADTGRPLADVSVNLRNERQQIIESVTTDATGAYAMINIAPGSYRVQFDPAPGLSSTAYIGQYANGKPTFGSADPVQVGGGPVVVNATLVRGATISGAVLAADTGAGLSRVTVTITDDRGRIITYGMTDEAGRYTTNGLPPGSYRVRFNPDSPGPSAQYISRYYGDALLPERSTTVDVFGLPADASIVLRRGVTISGMIAGDTGLPVSDVTVSVLNESDELMTYIYSDKSGAYTTSGLPPGRYRIQFLPAAGGPTGAYVAQYYRGRASAEFADLIAVGTANVTDINGNLGSGASVGGRVTDAETGLALDGVTVLVLNRDGTFVAVGYTDSTGRYATSGVPNGRYVVQFMVDKLSVSSGYASEYYFHKPTLELADTVAIGARPFEPIDFFLWPGLTPSPRLPIQAALAASMRR